MNRRQSDKNCFEISKQLIINHSANKSTFSKALRAVLPSLVLPQLSNFGSSTSSPNLCKEFLGLTIFLRIFGILLLCPHLPYFCIVVQSVRDMQATFKESRIHACSELTPHCNDFGSGMKVVLDLFERSLNCFGVA